MWFDGIRQPNTLYVASTSRGKDSTAMLRAIQLMGWPLDMIVSVDIWFDEETPAELPPMVKFKNEYDEKVLKNFGVPVTRLCAQKRSQNVQVEREPETDGEDHTSRSVDCSTQRCIPRNTDGTLKDSQTTTTHGASCSRIRPMECMSSRLTYVDAFYRRVPLTRATDRINQLHVSNKNGDFRIYGFPMLKRAWCNSELKTSALRDSRIRDAISGQTLKHPPFSIAPPNEGQEINIIHYIGIAADEPIRIERHMDKKDMVMPLVQIGWDEDLCGLEAQYLDMLSPTYETGTRDGCWFCHNQGVGRLRNLRKNYPDLWEKLMKLDLDSPVTFHADGHTVHDFDRRFQLEDEGLIYPNERFRWAMLDEELNYRLF